MATNQDLLAKHPPKPIFKGVASFRSAPAPTPLNPSPSTLPPSSTNPPLPAKPTATYKPVPIQPAQHPPTSTPYSQAPVATTHNPQYQLTQSTPSVNSHAPYAPPHTGSTPHGASPYTNPYNGAPPYTTAPPYAATPPSYSVPPSNIAAPPHSYASGYTPSQAPNYHQTTAPSYTATPPYTSTPPYTAAPPYTSAPPYAAAPYHAASPYPATPYSAAPVYTATPYSAPPAHSVPLQSGPPLHSGPPPHYAAPPNPAGHLNSATSIHTAVPPRDPSTIHKAAPTPSLSAPNIPHATSISSAPVLAHPPPFNTASLTKAPQPATPHYNTPSQPSSHPPPSIHPPPSTYPPPSAHPPPSSRPLPSAHPPPAHPQPHYDTSAPALPPKLTKNTTHHQDGRDKKEMDKGTHEAFPSADVFMLEDAVPSRLLSATKVDFKDDEFHFGDSIHIGLKEKKPSLQTNNTSYLLTHKSRLYLIKLSAESPHFTHVLEKYSGFYKPVEVKTKELVGEDEYTQKASSAAVGIEKGGTVISQGLIKGATFVGMGVKKTSTVVINNTDKGNREVTEEERKQTELRQQRTATFLSGARVVTGGIGKGAKFLGEGISKAHNKVRGPQEEEATENAQKKAAIGVGGAAANAFGSIVSGVCESTKIIGSDVKDSAVDVTRHREGDEAAGLTEKQFNTAGQASVGTIHAVSLAATGTIKVAVRVGAAAATFDNDWKRLMEGASWKEGWLSNQDETLGPWVTKRFVLRSYALAIYKNKEKDRNDPIMYIPTLDILTAEKVDFKVTKKALCFKLVTKSGTFFFSVDCPDKEKKDKPKKEMKDVETWIDVILGLARVCDGTIE